MSVNHHLTDFDTVLQSMRQKKVSLGALFKIFHDSSTLASDSDQLRKDKSLYGTFAKDALPWAFEAVTTELCREVHQLSQRSHGLHFNNAKATANFLEGSFMEKAAEKLREVITILIPLLLNNNGIQNVRVLPDPVGEMMMTSCLLS